MKGSYVLHGRLIFFRGMLTVQEQRPVWLS